MKIDIEYSIAAMANCSYYNLMQAINVSTGTWEQFLVQYDSDGEEIARNPINGLISEFKVSKDLLPILFIYKKH